MLSIVLHQPSRLEEKLFPVSECSIGAVLAWCVTRLIEGDRRSAPLVQDSSAADGNGSTKGLADFMLVVKVVIWPSDGEDARMDRDGQEVSVTACCQDAQEG